MSCLAKLTLAAIGLAMLAFQCTGGETQSHLLNVPGCLLAIGVGGGMWLASGRSRQRR